MKQTTWSSAMRAARWLTLGAGCASWASCGGELADPANSQPVTPVARPMYAPPPQPIVSAPPPAPAPRPAPPKPECVFDADCPRKAEEGAGTIRVCEAQKCVAKPEAELVQWANSVVALEKQQRTMSPSSIDWVKPGKPLRLYVDVAAIRESGAKRCVPVTLTESGGAWKAKVSFTNPTNPREKCTSELDLSTRLEKKQTTCGSAPASTIAPSDGYWLVRVPDEKRGHETLSYVGVKGRVRVACDATTVRRKADCSPRECTFCKLVAKFEEPGQDASGDNQLLQISTTCDPCPADRASDKLRADHVLSHVDYVRVPRAPLAVGLTLYRSNLDCVRSPKKK